jgi:tRNA(Ile)-lysidine synthase TilS/MesJ
MSRRWLFGPDDATRTEFGDELLALAKEAYDRAEEALIRAARDDGPDGVLALMRGEVYLGFARACREIAEEG